ncbi:hypothetical protein Pelo_15167 [Pelomyxa schiedti]|nr:hypothetical protein Pelo_15167 [Pelomyxa schiedti]
MGNAFPQGTASSTSKVVEQEHDTGPVTPAPPPLVSTAAFSVGDQFAALLASSLPRCGELSPARPVCSLSTLAHHIWRTWVAPAAPPRRPAVFVTLAVENKGDAASARGAARASVAFGVSPATLGLTRGGRVGTSADFVGWVAPGVSAKRTWSLIGEGEVRGMTIRMQRHGSAVGTAHAWGGRNDYLQISREGVLCDAVNHKWWVRCERNNGETVATAVGIPSVTGIPVPREMGSSLAVLRLFLNNPAPDEALLLSGVSNTIYLTLLDIPQTWESKKIAVLEHTSIPILSVPMPIVALIFRRKKTDGSVAFIFKSSAGAVFQVEAATGEAKMLSKRCSDLSQLNDSMFCIGKAYDCERSYELWDCHNTEKPVRFIQRNNNCEDNFDQVIAGCGLLFAVRERDRKIDVIDASSGLSVLITIDVLFSSSFYINEQSSLFFS